MSERRYDFPERMKLLGDFYCELTNAEANEWDTYIRSHPTFKAFRQCGVDMRATELAIAGGALEREPELRAACDRYHTVGDQLFGVASKWYADLTAKDAKPEAATTRTD